MNKQISNSIMASLVADAYALGAHWIYEEAHLKSLPIDWETLNKAQSMWHKGKAKGDFTHYGDQTLYLLEYMSQNKEFDKNDYYPFWSEKMSNYAGYVDGATRSALVKIGSESNELSICGHIAPLLIDADTKEIFLSRCKEFAEITHNSKLAVSSTLFFAELLWDSKENKDIKKNIELLKSKYPKLLTWIDAGVKSKDADTFSTIREFGPACGIDGGFAGVIHLLSLEDDFKTVMQKNAKAGGDSSARGMVVAMILATQDDFELPDEWMNAINTIEDIKNYLSLV
ncbi:protein containing ADP-ribosylation/Crisallin J1 domain [Sulfurimonas gotlandica GD1]|uniref:Protein containing ADP-ribosylation/Crisallin J1 domain n=1 Tax=Sulfurimonas gotlandica (strain DSM 19862 / JCM 16533 / GD1) TaxID=929558 RepID=B6BNN6_SULGG|nr:ADP-ribosylglycohydrolase family protein [Sulfurimonas gotlandica]EDZ61300.1 ADP-ribosylation/Crystallin J1, putative [Sulfurimonas gotlandica GD1]EHP28839.1 protein containing ADP-ribosylation/Crisallin J1 domain [Sulfurimonas gotlandica GD1]